MRSALLYCALLCASLMSFGISTTPTAALAGEQPVSVARQFSDSLQHVALDLRGSRGGHGDVAAAYLTALDLMRRHKYRGRITFLIDEGSQRILGKLIGSPVKSGQSIFGGKIQVYFPTDVPKELPAADLYLSLARPSGKEAFSKDFVLPGEGGGIPITSKTVRITQTVLGNTENVRSDNPNGLLQIGDEKFRLRSAGYGANEAGIYHDPVAWSLRAKTPAQTRDFVKSSLGHFKDTAARQMIHDVVSKKTLVGAELGLVYGITASDVKAQFESYLKGLAEDPQSSKKSFTLLTPSSFSLDQVTDQELRSKITVIEKGKPVPLRAAPGRIYVVKTGTLPHRTFVGLMALSELPPVVAGDGALSAAIGLGKPFVMTQVLWNSRNVQNLGLKLAEKAGEATHSDSLFRRVYPASGAPDLSSALKLRNRGSVYGELSASIPLLTDSMLESAHAARDAVQSGFELEKIDVEAVDPALRKSIQKKAAFKRSNKHAYFRELLRNNPNELSALIIEGSEGVKSHLLTELQEVLLQELRGDPNPVVLNAIGSTIATLSNKGMNLQSMALMAEEILVKDPAFFSAASAGSIRVLKNAIVGGNPPYVLQRSAEYLPKLEKQIIQLMSDPTLTIMQSEKLSSGLIELGGMGVPLSPEAQALAANSKHEALKKLVMPAPKPIALNSFEYSFSDSKPVMFLDEMNKMKTQAAPLIADEDLQKLKKTLEDKIGLDKINLEFKQAEKSEKSFAHKIVDKAAEKYKKIKFMFVKPGFVSSGATPKLFHSSTEESLKGLLSGFHPEEVGQSKHLHLGSLSSTLKKSILADDEVMKAVAKMDLALAATVKLPKSGQVSTAIDATQNHETSAAVSTYKQKIFNLEAVVINGQVHLKYPQNSTPGSACAAEVKAHLKSVLKNLPPLSY